MATQTKDDRLTEVGKSAYASIVEMVAALECDYDRLEELKEQRETLVDEVNDAHGEHQAALSEQDGTEEETKAAEESARAKLAEWDEEYAEELTELQGDAACGDDKYPCKDQDEARERIQQDALSVRIFGERTDGEWEADKFEILLTTGGPAVRIMGELDGNSEPSHAWLETQDWGTPWTEYYETGIRDTLLAYCRCFYFGE